MGLKEKMAQNMLNKAMGSSAKDLSRVLESIHAYLEIQTAYQKEMLKIMSRKEGKTEDEIQRNIDAIEESAN